MFEHLFCRLLLWLIVDVMNSTRAVVDLAWNIRFLCKRCLRTSSLSLCWRLWIRLAVGVRRPIHFNVSLVALPHHDKSRRRKRPQRAVHHQEHKQSFAFVIWIMNECQYFYSEIYFINDSFFRNGAIYIAIYNRKKEKTCF